MGRLFWKFFFAILFAQVLATLGVGATFWLLGEARELSELAGDGVPVVDTRCSARATLDAAAVAFKFGATPGLREFTRTGVGAKLYVIDGAGKELNARPASADLLSEAQRLLAPLEGPSFVRQFTGENGQRYIAFVSRSKTDFGPPRDASAVYMGPPPVFGAPGKPGPHSAKGGGGPREGHRLPYITMIVGTLASLLFAAMLARYMSQPIRALRSAFAAAAAGDLAPRFAAAKPGSGDELTELGQEFDRMSGQLHALIENQRRLLHDVSHELRSPLARLQAAIGLAYQQPDKVAPSLDRIERESIRMDKLIGELLTLSRLDTAAHLPSHEEIAIQDLVHEIATDAAFEAEQVGKSVRVISEGAASITGSPDLLWRGIENVVRNAIKFSPDEGLVEIDLQISPEWVSVLVLDRGPGVPEEHLTTIFQPFFRLEPTENNVGHGLGLAIAQRVIAAHGGSISASNRPGGGLCVAIRLPRSDAPT